MYLIGHSAKFGSYTMMDLKSKNVIDLQLVQVFENKYIEYLCWY